MSRLILFLIAASALVARASASGLDSLQAISDEFQKIVQSSAAGDIRAALTQMNALAQAQKDPKDLQTEIDDFRANTGDLAEFGPVDTVELLSAVTYGNSLARIRYIEKRQKGAVLWTFFCYRYHDLWYLKTFRYTGKEDFEELISQNLDAADTKSVVIKDTSP